MGPWSEAVKADVCRRDGASSIEDRQTARFVDQAVQAPKYWLWRCGRFCPAA